MRRNRPYLKFTLFLAVVVLAGCAATPLEMDGLTEAPGNVVFSLGVGIQIQEGSQAIYLAGGDYRLVKKNSLGSMYAAPSFGVIRKSSRGFMGFRGGVWVPLDMRTSAKIYVLYETSERLYPDLRSALSLPADEERKMLEEERAVAERARPPGAEPKESAPPFEYGNIAYSPVVTVVMGIAETQRGKPDVIAEISQVEFQKRLKASAPASKRD